MGIGVVVAPLSSVPSVEGLREQPASTIAHNTRRIADAVLE